MREKLDEERKKELRKEMNKASGAVHTEKFKNAALFLWLGLPSTLIRHENGAFRKRSSNRRNSKTAVLGFNVEAKHFEIGVFQKRWGYDKHISSPNFTQTQIQNDR